MGKRLVGEQAVGVLVYKPVVDAVVGTFVGTAGCRKRAELAVHVALESPGLLERLKFPLCQESHIFEPAFLAYPLSCTQSWSQAPS